MHILISPNAFKGTIESHRAAQIIAEVIQKRTTHTTKVCPIADGGDGTSYLLGLVLNLKRVEVPTYDAVGRKRSGYYYVDSITKTSYIDVSSATGIKHLREEEKDARKTSTYGTGLLMKHAVQLGSNHIVLGLGGSATVDVGLGILQGLGFEFYDKAGKLIEPCSNNLLFRLKKIIRQKNLPNFEITILCDVSNSFFGEQGAIPVFGPQKGIKNDEIEIFESVATEVFKIMKKDKPTLQDQSGFGAAGGIALGLSAYFTTKLVNGFDFYFQSVGMANQIAQCDWLITGEGRYDSQSVESGKGCYALHQHAKSLGKKSVLITSGDIPSNTGFDVVVKLPDLDFESSNYKQMAERNLVFASEKLIADKIL